MPPLSKIKFVVPKDLAKYVGKSVPHDAKMMGAKGSLPLQPKQLAIVLFYLAHDPDPEVKAAAEKSLMNLPQPVIKTLLEAPDTHPLILDFFARRLDPESGFLDTIALNKVTHDETIAYLAGKPFKNLVEIISNNQTRLLRHPKIVDVLSSNPMVGQATIERILHFISLETSSRVKKEEKAAIQAGEEEKEEEQEEAAEEEYEEEEIPDYMKDEEYPWVDDEEELPDHWSMADIPSDLSEDSDEELEEEDYKHLSQKIADMGISEKIKTAMLGNKEARSILIKDANKMVSSAVLQSPKITEEEIEAVSRSRAISDEIIRQIANNRDWTRNYSVKLNLVNNVKTPLHVSMKFLNHLTQKDVRQISRSKDVPAPVATAARKLIQKRQEKKG